MGSVAEQLDKHRALIARLNQAEAERDEARALLIEIRTDNPGALSQYERTIIDRWRSR